MKSQLMFKVVLGGLLLVMLAGCAQIIVEPASEPGPVELAVRQSEEKATAVEVTAGSAYYATNPELMAARRHEAARVAEMMTGSAYYATNPELMAAQRYTAAGQEQDGSAYYAANPELMIARRYTAALAEK